MTRLQFTKVRSSTCYPCSDFASRGLTRKCNVSRLDPVSAGHSNAGMNATGHSLGVVCTRTSRKLVSSTGLTVVFRTNGSIQNRGFLASFVSGATRNLTKHPDTPQRPVRTMIT